MHHDAQAAILGKQKKQMIVGLLDHVCQQIEISETQYQAAKSRYEAVGTWLANTLSPHLKNAQIYSQGSVALGTTIKPIKGEEFDVDLVCHLPTLSNTSDARVVKALIGDRLKENETYNGMLEEKQRCWRINYANQFHLDITPSIENPQCKQNGVLVPDKALSQWKPTNPKGYTRRFEQYASLVPSFYLAETRIAKAVRDGIEPLPSQTMSKPMLKRIIQLLKRHRDHMFVGTSHADLAPISVIITTLAGRSYEKCVSEKKHADAFDFLTSVIREMLTFIKLEYHSSTPYFVIENETTVGENFADKWNKDQRLAKSFYDWHESALSSVDSLLQLEGTDRFAESLKKNFGTKDEQIRKVLSSLTNDIGQARSSGRLAVAPTIGLITTHAHGSVAIPKNTFFGQ